LSNENRAEIIECLQKLVVGIGGQAVKRTVLVVDDDPILMETVATMLHVQRDVKVLRAGNGAEAFRHLDSNGAAIELIICDLNMPDCDGIEVILELSNRGTRTPILFVTGAVVAVVNAASILARVHKLNVVDILIKPVSIGGLLAAVDPILVNCSPQSAAAG
jgi:DNA-binding response OmpR family regulator